MRRHPSASVLGYLFSLIATLSLVTGCQDKTSTIGGPFFPDTLSSQSATLNDTTSIKLSSYAKPTVTVAGQSYNITGRSPLMIVGRVSDAHENLESWGLLQFPIVQGDTLARTVGLRLILKTIGYKYGDTTNNHVDLQVYGEGAGKVNDSTLRLTKADLTPTAFGGFQGDLFDSSYNELDITLDTSIKTQLTATSFAFVLTPGLTMSNCRAFATFYNAATNAGSVPELEYTVRVDTGLLKIYKMPARDLFVTMDNSTTPAGEFTIRGGLGQREHVLLNLTTDSLHLDQFTTINSAQLVLKLDPDNSKHSNLVSDSAGPVIAEIIGTSDTSTVLYSNGTRDPIDPNTYRFQLRTLVEYWLRNPTQNFGIDLRSGYSGRVFAGETVAVEDNTINRWTFYGSDATDPAKRPQLVLSYAKLK